MKIKLNFNDSVEIERDDFISDNKLNDKLDKAIEYGNGQEILEILLRISHDNGYDAGYDAGYDTGYETGVNQN